MNNIYNKTIIKIALKSFAVVSFLMIFSCDPDETQTVATFNKLVMADEFDIEGAPNSAFWTYDIGTGPNGDGWGNNELQHYTDRTENVTVENGYLLITAREEAFSGSNYTSARITTQGLFEQAYGRFEARIKVPYGKGYWPAFWILGNDCAENTWPQCGEIDIMEYLGDELTTTFGSAHGPGFSGADAITKDYVLDSDRFDTGFHVFGIEWAPNYINYYVDGDLYQQITREVIFDETDGEGEWVFDNPFYIILNVAIGGNFPGSPNSETVFPQTMLVDYVRVYKQ
ncbi:glycoside hydrolase family 16 protein [Winogradskyella sp. UBA3174]|mgnify:CR=1 FL=1|uniref:glycoside hydrolase family 16 protein n=1 Tax=Winogradskyella sp. UBA3174 TaxID=1947785 RepID=UPI0025EE9F40|nr:glycoside hydrolase family 16 protein [Winogradskyella sp. UBA3174]|tara:strand:+ start:16067 stop:16921 length:855 start_codon:yes stop_codon:yes gene_type:complete